jgi:hypothetical protein
MTCQRICVHYKAASNHYANGLKRCQVCQLFIKWNGLFCPCCGYRLRAKPRNFKLKSKLREQQVIEEAKKIDNMTRWMVNTFLESR